MRYLLGSGDYGLAFFGASLNAGSYVVQHPLFGWVCYMCDVVARASTVTITPRDAYQRRMYLEPLGLWLDFRTGNIVCKHVHIVTARHPSIAL